MNNTIKTKRYFKIGRKMADWARLAVDSRHGSAVMPARGLESGRSMVEILGVLAVAGVLSVGGISGYRFAMDKYRANDIANEVNLRNRDTWYRYQTQDLPLDEDIIGEWSNTTPTGFPISVVPRSRLMFDVWVDEVPSKVCKNVLNMNIVGPLFVWTTTDGGETRNSYNGTNPEICGNEGTTSVVFTTTLEKYNEPGLRPDEKDENGRPIRHCLEETDCRECETCHDRDPYTCNSTCPDETPICMEKADGRSECVECEFREDCPAGEACNEHHRCEPLPEECPAGTFRSKGGSCVSCKSPTNVLVSDEVFEGDATSGADMCNACATAEGDLAHKRNYEVAKNGDLYCSYACTVGVSVQSKTAITLKNKDGTTMVDENGKTVTSVCRPCWDNRAINVSNDTESKKQCDACSQVFYSQRHWPGDYFCEGWSGKCETNYIREGDPTSTCKPCTDYQSNVQPMSTTTNDWDKKGEEMCRACSNFLYWKPNKICILKCKQPTNMSEEESIRICKEEGPSSSKCKRQLMALDYWSSCVGCNYSSVIYVGTDTTGYEYQSCLDCGRYVDGTGRCFLKQPEDCSMGQFRDSSGTCRSCSNYSAYDILGDDTTCVNNCKIKSKDENGNITFYGPDDDPEEAAAATSGRYVLGGKCFLDCPKNYVNGDNNSGCKKCDVKNGSVVFPFYGHQYLEEGKKACTERCPTYRIFGSHWYACVDDCPTGQYRARTGYCYACNGGNRGDDDSIGGYSYEKNKEECEACGNRIVITAAHFVSCSPLNPGTWGICNSISPEVPEAAKETYGEKAKPYLNGDYDGKLFLTYGGACKSCTDQGTYTATQVQCESCGNRRYSGGSCSYGLCSEGSTFANSSSTCIDCSTTAQKTQIRNGTESLCTACSGKRVMTDADDKSYCVAECGSQWQNLAGACLSDTAGGAEIGTDSTSRQLCRDTGRIAYSKLDANDKTHWYCSDKPEKDKFININGATVSCTSTERTQIPDTTDAQNLCRGTGDIANIVGCSFGQRSVTQDSETSLIYCEKN